MSISHALNNNYSLKIRQSIGLTAPIVIAVMAYISVSFIDDYISYIVTSWVIFGLLALSLDVIWGRCGILSLGQTAFYGLGGYVGSIVAINISQVTGVSLFWSVSFGAITGITLAIMVGLLIFYTNMGALQTTILTYTLILILWSLFQSFSITIGSAVVGGDNGMSNIPGYIIGLGGQAEMLMPKNMLSVTIIIALLIYLMIFLIMRSPFGQIIDCIRLDIDKTKLLGYDVRKYQLFCFALSGGVAGIAGALFAAWANYISPSIFSVQEAMLVPIYVLIGGLGTLAGPFVGAVFIGALSFWLGGGAVGGQTTLILGALLIVLVLFLKKGVLGAIDDLWKKTLHDDNAMVNQIKPVTINEDKLRSLFKLFEKKSGLAKSLSTENAIKSFGGVIPVNNVSLKFQQGKAHSLIGPNGAGKSSFLKLCVGIYLNEKGKVILDGNDISKMKIYQRVQQGLGVKNQKPQVFGKMSIYQNLWLAAYSLSKDKKYAHDTAKSILAMLGMMDQKFVDAEVLSHGQQQWLDIGMTLCASPRVILLDEPAAGLTNEETRELSKLIRIIAEYITVIVVEHDMDFIRTLEGVVTVLHQGEVFAQSDIETLQKNADVLDIYLGRGKNVNS